MFQPELEALARESLERLVLERMRATLREISGLVRPVPGPVVYERAGIHPASRDRAVAAGFPLRPEWP